MQFMPERDAGVLDVFRGVDLPELRVEQLLPQRGRLSLLQQRASELQSVLEWHSLHALLDEPIPSFWRSLSALQQLPAIL